MIFIFHTTVVSLSQVDQFLENLIKFDKENIADPNRKAIRPYLDNSDFDPDFIRNKSTAAAGITMYSECMCVCVHAV